jgi:hypothetical protein
VTRAILGACAPPNAVFYEARLVNQELGQYKGYPLDPDEWPEKLTEISEDSDR